MNAPKPIDHFVLTRFNIASPGREAPIRNSPGWLARRFELFETYCLPSMAAQSNKAFQWIIYFDEATPDAFRERIKAAQQKCLFEPIFVGFFEAADSAHDVTARLSPQARRVITTRLDNDDAVAQNFIDRVQEEAGQIADATIINFSDGIALNQGRLFSAHDPSNPFASLVEDRRQIETIWSAPHMELIQRFPTHQIADEPAWLQVVHGENVTNRIKGKRLRDRDLLNRFALAKSVVFAENSSAAMLLDRLVAFPYRQLREAGIRLLKGALGRH